ncbi:MAG TPA: GNAT family N-acetyltransferase [Usitatibacteraceae bacterium]|nr:GNAT family N-acetyltransferase [Usitatibacteraceae bacterium]
MSAPRWDRAGFSITCALEDADIDAVHRWLSEESYWARGIPRHIVEKAVAHSIPFTLRADGAFAGFARVTTDRATVAYLGDVFILPPHRGKGLSKWLIACVLEHPDLQGLRRFILATSDAHGLYARYGFTPFTAPHLWMEIHDPQIYRRPAGP